MALRRTVFVACLLLAGCAGTPEAADDEESATAPTTFTSVADNRVPVALTTDTFHFLAQPGVTPRPPTAFEPLRVPVHSVFDAQVSAGQTLRQTWNVTLAEEMRGFVGNATFFVDVQGGSLVGNPYPTAQGCFWAFGVVVGQSDSLSGELAESYALGCAPEGLQVPPGQYELSLPFALAEVVWPAGTELHFGFHTNEPVQRSPGVTVDLLTAGINHDSRLQVYGLEMPIERVLLAT